MNQHFNDQTISSVSLKLQCKGPRDVDYHTLNTRVIHISDVPKHKSELQVFTRNWQAQDFLADHVFRIEIVVPRSH